MSALGPFVLIVAGVLVVMVAGLLIAGLTSHANGEEACPEWVAVTHEHSRACPDPVCTRQVWTPCPHRRPCPLHDRNGVRRHAQP